MVAPTQTEDWGSLMARIVCSPWQVVHTGASLIPAETARPWMLCRKTPRTLAWQRPQVSGTFLQKTLLALLAGPCKSCEPWQLVQTAAFKAPPARACPWTVRV